MNSQCRAFIYFDCKWPDKWSFVHRRQGLFLNIWSGSIQSKNTTKTVSLFLSPFYFFTVASTYRITFIGYTFPWKIARKITSHLQYLDIFSPLLKIVICYEYKTILLHISFIINIMYLVMKVSSI